MEGAHQQTFRRTSPHQAREALLHLFGSLVGKGDGGDVRRTETAFIDQPSDLVRNDTRLAAARAGQHEARAVKKADRLALRRIELGRHGKMILSHGRMWRPVHIPLKNSLPRQYKVTV